MPPFNGHPLTNEQRDLAARNVGLVFAVVRELVRYRSLPCLGEDDAIGEGMLALCKAARGYRAGRQGRRGRATPFSDYAGRAVKREVRRAEAKWKGGMYWWK